MGFVKVDRNIKNWKWFNKDYMLRGWIYLLSSAYYRDGYYEGVLIKKGQVPVGRDSLAEKLQISPQQARTLLKRLKSTNEITIETTNKFTIVTIVKWLDYQLVPEYINQQNSQDVNQQITSNQPTDNQQITTIKEVLELKELKESFLENELVNDLPFPDVQKRLDAKEQEQIEIDNANLFDLLEKEFGRTISQREVVLLGEWQSAYEHRLIYYAIREAVMYEKDSLDYVDKILVGWNKEGYMVADIEDGRHRERKE